MFDWQLLGAIFILYLPAMAANSMPIVANKLNVLLWLNKPIDFGNTLRGTRILGDNKTIRGFVVGVASAGLIGILVAFLTDAKPYDSYVTALAYSLAVGFGALAGDSIKSFFKRRLGFNSGEMWIVFDQIDFILGATFAMMFFVDISFIFFITAIIFVGCISFVTSAIGFALHIKKNL